MSHAPSAEPATAATQSLSPARREVSALIILAVLAGGALLWASVIGQPLPPLAAGLIATLCIVVSLVTLRKVLRSPAADAATVSAADTETPKQGQQEQMDPRHLLPLATRLMRHVLQQLRIFDKLESVIADPDILEPLYEADHLAVQLRRLVETILVFAGEPVHKNAREPLSIQAITMAAIGEISRYSQVECGPVEDVEITPEAHGDLRHVVAELLDNATAATDPQGERVVVRASMVPAGLMIQIRDAGLTPQDLGRYNTLLKKRPALGEVLAHGRYGLPAVSVIASNRDFSVWLQHNRLGGTDAVVIVPHEWLHYRDRAVGDPIEESAPATSRRWRSETRITGEIHQRAADRGSPGSAVGALPAHSTPPQSAGSRPPLPKRKPTSQENVPPGPRPTANSLRSGSAPSPIDPSAIEQVARVLGTSPAHDTDSTEGHF